jgi:CheY-like chemotaxis protein
VLPILLDLSFENNKIMVIDDEYNANNVITFFLEKEGYKVDSFSDPIEALNSYRKNRYDLVLVDSQIPKLKELSLYHKFKEIDSKVPICFTNADMDSILEIKRQIPDLNNNNTIFKSLSLDDQTKLDILLLENNDTILKKP